MTDVTTESTSLGTSPGWLLTGGILVLLGGIFMLVFPTMASLSVTLLAGWALIFAGIVGFVAAIRNRAGGGMWVGMTLGVLAVIAGILLAFNPLAGTLTLTMVFVWWLIIDGIIGAVLSIVRRGPAWGWWLASSLLGLLLGILLLNMMPLGTAFILGTFVGIVMMIRGFMLIIESLEVRRLRKA